MPSTGRASGWRRLATPTVTATDRREQVDLALARLGHTIDPADQLLSDFTVEQLAGDPFPVVEGSGSPPASTATPRSIGGAKDEENRINAVIGSRGHHGDDLARRHPPGAQRHDKFDLITQIEYYGLFACPNSCPMVRTTR